MSNTRCLCLLALLAAAQTCLAATNSGIPDAPLPQTPAATQPGSASAQPPSQAAAAEPLTREQAEQLALKNNPRISEAALLALAQQQVVRETRSAELPTVNGNLTAVGAEEASRISSGSLSASRLLNHVGAGLTFNQLITDFGHTHNLVASASLQARASEQTSLATREEIVLAVDLAFYDALAAQAALKVAQSTVDARSNVNDQVGALAASHLKSTLDQSFAQVQLSQAQLLVLDAQNLAVAAMARLNEVLAVPTPHEYQLTDDTGTLSSLPSSVEEVVSQALQQRPDLEAQRLNHQADVRFSRAQHEQLLPTVSALGIVGSTPYGSSTYFTEDWYGAAGVNIGVPIFNGFKFHAEAQEADLRARASEERTRQLTDRITRDARTAWLTANTAQQRMAVTRQLLVQANTALDLAKTRYQLGLSSIVELSQAELQQTEAEIADSKARFEYEADLATIRFQTGTQP